MLKEQPYKFVNPYNFISLREGDSKKSLSEYSEGTERLTGKLSCRIIAKTPLIVPDLKSGEKKKGCNVYPFMTVNGRAMIPGSSLRGVIRSAYEAITDSCVFLNDDYYFSSRTGIAKNAGLLKKVGDNDWALYEADRYAAKDVALSPSHKTGTLVKFDGYADANGKLYVKEVGSGSKSGYVLKMNRFKKGDKLSAYSIFSFKSGNGKRLDSKIMETFRVNIDKYIEAEKNKRDRPAEYYKSVFNSLPIDGFIPVWYEYTEGSYSLALSQLSRNVYTNKPKDLLGKSFDSLTKCVNKNELCPACALFGFVGSDKEGGGGASGSRVRISDAWCGDEGALSSEPAWIPFLASPKSSSLEFYLRYNEHFYHADTPGALLAGRKFYWHHNPFHFPKEEEPSRQNDDSGVKPSYMQYAEINSDFIFDVYFENITPKQLNELYTALTFGDNDENGNLCHKIGHAKPLGFGSVKISVSQVVSRSFSHESGYVLNNDYLGKLVPVGVPDELKIAVSYDSVVDQRVDYPRVSPGGEIYQWFSKNRPPSGTGSKAYFRQKLPKTADTDQNLYGDFNKAPRGEKQETVHSASQTSSFPANTIANFLDSQSKNSSKNTATEKYKKDVQGAITRVKDSPMRLQTYIDKVNKFRQDVDEKKYDFDKNWKSLIEAADKLYREGKLK